MSQKVFARSSTKANILANLIGKAWVAIMSLAFLPILVEKLGNEAYGLVGVYISVYSLINLLDLGLSTVLNKTFSTIDSVNPESVSEASNTLMTFERFYLVIGSVVSIVLFASAPLVSNYLLELENISPATVTGAIRIMSAVIFFQWLMILYTGGLLGLERQIELNIVKSIHASLQWGGAALALLVLRPSISTFFFCQLGANILSALWMRHQVWQSINTISNKMKPKFDINCWHRNKKFIGGLTAYTVIFTVVGQVDRIVVINTLPLEHFGHFTLAMQVTGALMYIGIPIYFASFPRFSRMISENDPGLATLYHKLTQLLGVLTVPVCIILIVDSEFILNLWLQNSGLVKIVAEVVEISVIGVSVFVMNLIPLSLMLAMKSTKKLNRFNLLALLVLPLPMYFLVQSLGLVGAPLAMVGYHILWAVVLVPLLHKEVLQGELSRWLAKDLMIPISVAVLSYFLLNKVIPDYTSTNGHIFRSSLLWLLMFTAMVLSSSMIRATIFNRFSLQPKNSATS